MILGHDANAARFDKALDTNRLHHAYLLTGPRGVGKATFAHSQLIKLMPAQNEAMAEQSTDLLNAASHPDFVTLEIEADPKTGKIRSEITRPQVEKLIEFLSKHASISRRKVVLIDSIDDLNQNAANNLLKWLEEPRPETCLLLISHRPESILPTIRSRCAQMTFSALTADEFAAFARSADLDHPDALFSLTQGSPGEALELADANVLETLERLDGMVSQLGRLDPEKLIQVAKALLPKNEIESFKINLRILRHVLRAHALDMGSNDFFTLAYDRTQGLEAQVRKLNLDMGQVWLGLLLDLHDMARQRHLHAA